MIAFSSDYLAFGLSYGLSGAESFMYTGKQFDPSTGLYYYGARFYDDVLGRFITEDTNTGRREDPQSLNRYIYARDSNKKIIASPTPQNLKASAHHQKVSRGRSR
ncbi:MAG: RHS repeat-associated core domain-containing protein, partial [Nitrososphaerales archaeon]